MKKAKVTVYIVSHNYGKYLQEAIESVLRQNTGNWELFLINNNSSDNTKDIMSLYRRDPRIRIFDTANQTLAPSANLALKNANGDYIIRLDADDIFDENILLILCNYLDKNSDVAWVFPDYFLVDDSGDIMRYEKRQSIYHSNHLLDTPANGACTLIRKEILKKIGGYREDLSSQDGFDLWTRLSCDYKCANVNLPLFYYRRHGKNLTENQPRIMNARRTIKKDSCIIDSGEHRPLIAVIPCRKYYDIFPDIWSKKISNKMLLENTIEICLRSSIFDKIVVTSDNHKAKDVLAGYKDPRVIFMPRTTESTSHSRSIAYTLEHIIKTLDIGWKGITVLCYPQAPFISAGTLEEAVYTLILNNTDSAFAVREIDSRLYKRSSYGLIPINPYGRIRSDFDIVYEELFTATATKNINIKNGSLTGAKISHFIVSGEEGFFINTKDDYEFSKLLSRNKQSPRKENNKRI